MTTTTRALIDLSVVHGTAELKLGQRFPIGKQATYFMQDYCYNANKRCLVPYSSGRGKKYVCDKEGCGWVVRVTCRELADGTKHMYVSTLNDQHDDFCTSVARATRRQVKLLPTFRAAVQANRRVKRKALIAMVQARDLANLQGCRSKLYLAKDEVLEEGELEWNASFGRIPFLLAELRDINPGTVVQLEVDQHQRFLRGFLAFGVYIAGQQALLPILGFDGAHCKHPKYNGVVLSLIGRDGNGQNVTMATALVNVENEGNLVWFLQMCKQAGITLCDTAVFCDRGKMLGAVEHFRSQTGIRVHLRFCTVHMLRNMKKHYGLSDQAFQNAVWNIQGAEKQSEFADGLSKLRRDYGDAVANYIASIPTDFWTVHANMSFFVPDPEPETSDADQDQPVDPSRPVHVKPTLSSASAVLPLFGWRSTNFVESENSSMIENGIRDVGPYEAFYKLAVTEMERCSERDLAISKWLKAKRTLTPHAKDLWEQERARVGEYHVRRSTSTIYFAVRTGSSRARRDISIPSCSCPTSDQLKISCRHINAVLDHCGLQERNLKAFHPSYLMQTNADAFSGKGIELPVRDTNMNSDLVKPSPFYKQAGRRVSRRIASTGEAATGKTYKCKVCTQEGHNHRTCKRHSNECDEANADLIPTVVSLPCMVRTNAVQDFVSDSAIPDVSPLSPLVEAHAASVDSNEATDEVEDNEVEGSEQDVNAEQNRRSRMSVAFIVAEN